MIHIIIIFLYFSANTADTSAQSAPYIRLPPYTPISVLEDPLRVETSHDGKFQGYQISGQDPFTSSGSLSPSHLSSLTLH